MPSTDALILDLSGRLQPVRRRSPSREAAALAGVVAAELLLVGAGGLVRPDMAHVLFSPFMLWKIGGLAVLAVASSTVAVRSFAPSPARPSPAWLVVAFAAALIATGTLVTDAADTARPLATRLAPVHGLLCAFSIVLLSLPVMALLARLMYRAAPVRPGRAAAAAGLAAATSGALVFTACCPVNDPFYVVVWYSVAVAAVTASARWLLPRRFRL